MGTCGERKIGNEISEVIWKEGRKKRKKTSEECRLGTENEEPQEDE